VQLSTLYESGSLVRGDLYAPLGRLKVPVDTPRNSSRIWKADDNVRHWEKHSTSVKEVAMRFLV
jgi:hypothetical protein